VDAKNHKTSLLDDVVWGVQHDAFNGDLGQSLLRAWSVGAGDGHVAEMIQQSVRPLRIRELFGELSPFRKPRLTDGDLTLGLDTERQPIRIPKDWLTSGMLLISNTGGGKTNFISFVALQLALLRCRVWISEMYKTHMRHLRPLFRKSGEDLVILRACDWKVNLLQAGQCRPASYLAMIRDLLVRLLGLPPRAQSILHQACHELYRRFGIWEGNTKAFPCLFDLYEFVRSTQGLNVAARDAILDRLGSLLLALTPRCAAYRSAWQATDLVQHSIVFELRGASELVKQVLLEPMLHSLLQLQIERGAIKNPLNLFVAFEDAQRFFGAHPAMPGSEILPMAELAGVVRSSGIGLGVLAQTAQGLAKSLLPNLATKLFGRLGTHEDFTLLGTDIGMTHSQVDWAKRKLSPGTFIGQASEGDWREPFVFNVPLLRINPTVAESDVIDSIKPLSMVPLVPADEFKDWDPYPVAAVAGTAPSSPNLSETELRYIKAVLGDPGKPCSYYAKAARMGAKQAVAVRKRLVQAGYLREHQVSTGSRGRNAILLEPLEPALHACEAFKET
jgi:hypothetical protein